MHDGASADFIYAAGNYFLNANTGRWIGMQRPVSWPRRSRGLNTLDFFPFGISKKIGVFFSCGYCNGIASARSKWLYLGQQHSWYFSTRPTIHAS
jgi:hypothetical protein